MTRLHACCFGLFAIAAFVTAGCERSDKPAAPPTPAPAAPEVAPPSTTPGVESPATRPVAAVPEAIDPAVSKARRQGVHAVWVTRMDYRTADDITRIMQNCKEAGFNHVIFQVRGNGTVFYPSQIEPWAEQFDFQSPGYDPLAHAIKEAHSRGMALQAWVNVMPAWRGLRPPPIPEQVYNKHPEWFWYDQHGKRQALSTFYVSLNPCLPEVRAYIVDVFREIVAQYEIDALHMDYIRFPNEPPAIPAGSGIDYPRDAKTLALYKEATGKAPDDDPEAWNRWRTEQVTQLVADIRRMMRETRPAVMLTASVGAERRPSMAHFRDDVGWVRAGLIDMAFPMNYKPDLPRFMAGMEPWMDLRDKVIVVPGLWTSGGPRVAREQIQAAVAATGNFCLFSYASLYDSREQDSVTSTRPAASTAPAGAGPAGIALAGENPGEAARPAESGFKPGVAAAQQRQPSTRQARNERWRNRRGTLPAGTGRSGAITDRDIRRRELVPVIQKLAATRPGE